jgi:hypothetical protein
MRRPRRWQSAGGSSEPAEEPVQAELDGVSVHDERERHGARGGGRQCD